MNDVTETYEPVAFQDVHEGDHVRFATADNGYGGSGSDVWHTGEVIRVTANTVTVRITGHNPMAKQIFTHGKSRSRGLTARLNRVDWNGRCVSRTVVDRPVRQSFTADNVRYVDEGYIVSAVWCSDPSIPPAVALENDLRSHAGVVPYEVVVIADATKYFKSEGADFSGWVVRCGGDYSDPISRRKPQAMSELRAWVEDYFTR